MLRRIPSSLPWKGLRGVASVSIGGGKEREIQVNLDEAKMFAYGLTVQQISNAISSDDITGTAGSVVKGSREISIRVMNEFNSLDTIKNVQISVPSSSGSYIPLSDIAEVKEAFKEDSTHTYVDGQRIPDPQRDENLGWKHRTGGQEGA